MTYIYVTPFFPSFDDWRGGYCLDFVKALKRQRLDMRVEVFACGCGGDYEIEGIKVWRFNEKYLPSGILPFIFRKYNEKSFLAAVERSTVDISDVVVCHCNTATLAPYSLAIKRLNANCRTILHHHDLASFGLNIGVLRHCAIYTAFSFLVFRKIFEKVDMHVFCSALSRRSFLLAPETSWTGYADYIRQMRGPRLFKCRPVLIEKSYVLHNGVDTFIFRNVKNVSSASAKSFVVGCIGNFQELKGQLLLIKAVERLLLGGYDMKLLFIGGDSTLGRLQKIKRGLSYKSVCERYVRKNGLEGRVAFQTEIPHYALPEFYSKLDLFVLPSQFEGFGCVYTESWACGTPFLACKGSPMEEVVADDEKEKWLCTPNDPDDLAKLIARYVKARDKQRLKVDVNIDTLVGRFIEWLNL